MFAFVATPAFALEAPFINRIEPNSAKVGDYVTVYGSNLYGNSVVLDGRTLSVYETNYSFPDTTGSAMTFSVPAGLAVGAHSVQIEQRIVGGFSNSATLNVISSTPTINYIQPSSGEKNILRPGETATVYGSNIANSFYANFEGNGINQSKMLINSNGASGWFTVPALPDGYYIFTLVPEGKGSESNTISVKVVNPVAPAYTATITSVQSASGEKNVLHPGEYSAMFGSNINNTYNINFQGNGVNQSKMISDSKSSGQVAWFYVPMIADGYYNFSLIPTAKGNQSNTINVRVVNSQSSNGNAFQVVPSSSVNNTTKETPVTATTPVSQMTNAQREMMIQQIRTLLLQLIQQLNEMMKNGAV